MSSQRTFRLFISSTFNDFRREREILQTQVFPIIKEYASSKNYTFQPIDLRWGVSDEAQLDQKTLELCLNEVRACKTTLHPNFLVMLGDRYGWIPLPYAIEASEFQVLYRQMTKDEKQLTLQWYSKDKNHLPASHILKERTGKYTAYDTWIKVENILRLILQNAATNSNLSQEKKEKYFQSATEAEVEEGILQFKNTTKFQKNVLHEENDSEHIFGFFRDIDKATRQKDKFIEDDYERAQTFKNEVKQKLLNQNILSVTTRQEDEESLDENYLLAFQEKITQFLKSQIDMQKEQELEENLSPLEIELQAQSLFALNKRKNFLAQEELRATIANYITSDTQEALVIHGKSGKGKSALMSKAIEEAESTLASKIVYRFVGATPHSGTSYEVLLSIFSELGFDLRSQKEELKNTSNCNLIASLLDQESFEEFSSRVYDIFFSLKENVTILIDAVDQFSNKDFFLWLPKELPKNVKIILSALEDTDYPEDTEKFEKLKERTDNLHAIPDFHQAEKLLDILLAQYSRQIDTFQKTYFLEQYSKVLSPLYIVLAVEEMKHWKSGDTRQKLEETQRGVVSEFISNLSTLYHHEKKFVERVLGFIYASRDGLSENELLQLLSVDKTFVDAMAPAANSHQNFNNELPLVHWSRLHTQLKPFLNVKMLNGQELISFTYREFQDVVSAMPSRKKEFQAIVSATQTLILQNQEKNFTDTRWGTLYYTLYINTPHSKNIQDELNKYSLWLLNIEDYYWLRNYINYVMDNLSFSSSEDKLQEVAFIIYHIAESTLIDTLLQDDPIKWHILWDRFLTIWIPISIANGKEQIANQLLENQSMVKQALPELLTEPDNFRKFLEYNSDVVCIEEMYSPIMMKMNEILPLEQNATNMQLSGHNIEAKNAYEEILIELEGFFESIEDGYSPEHPDFEVYEQLGQEKIYEALSNKTDFTEDEKVAILLSKELYCRVYNNSIASYIACTNSSADVENKVVENFQAVIFKLEKEFNLNHKLFGNIYIKSLVMLSTLYGMLEDAINAEKSLDQALIALKKVDPTTPDYQTLIYQVNNAKIVLEISRQNFNKAKEYALIAHEISKRLYGKDKEKYKRIYAGSLLLLQQVYFELKDKLNCNKNEELFNKLQEEEKDQVEMFDQLKELMTPCSKIRKFKISSLFFSGLALVLLYFLWISIFPDEKSQTLNQNATSKHSKTTHSSTVSTNSKSYSLRIRSEPNVKIKIINIKQKYYPGIKLSPGTYIIKVSKTGYRTKYMTLKIKDKNIRKKIYLEKLKVTPKKYSLTILTKPKAKIKILNLKAKYYSGIKLKPETYKIEVSKPGYKTKRVNIVLGNANKYQTIYLTKKKPTVKIKVPDNATLDKDGKDWSCDMGYMKIRDHCKRVI